MLEAILLILFLFGADLQNKVEMIVPMVIGDYTDFFASMHHAKNCGLMFRGPQNAINPNWCVYITFELRVSS